MNLQLLTLALLSLAVAQAVRGSVRSVRTVRRRLSQAAVCEWDTESASCFFGDDAFFSQFRDAESDDARFLYQFHVALFHSNALYCCV